MLNVIKGDLYKMFRMKAIWILNIIYVVYNFLTCYLLSEFDEIRTIYGIASNIPTLLSLFVGIFMCLFINSEYKNGYIKNIAGIVTDKIHIILSKIVVSAVFTVISIIIYMVTSVIFSLMFLKLVDFDNIVEALAYLGVMTLLCIALGMIAVMIVTAFRNGALAYIMTVLISTQFIAVLLNGLWTILQYKEIVSENFDISLIFLTNYFNTEADNLKGFIVAVVYIAVSSVISIFAVKKKDI